MQTKQSSTNKHKVLIAHRYFWPENLSLYAAMLKDIAEWHISEGHEVAILSARVDDPVEEQKRTAWAKQHSIKPIEFSAGKDRGSSSIRRLMNMFIYVATLLRTALNGKYQTILIASYPPILPAMICRWAKAWRNFEYIYYVQDIYPEIIGNQGGYLKKTLVKLLKGIDTKNVNQARTVLTLSEAMKQTLVKRGCNPELIVTLPNYAVDPPTNNQVSSVANSQPTLIFAGGVGKAQNLEFFLEAAQIASQSIDFKIVILGTGSELASLKSWALEQQITNIEFCGWLDRDKAQTMISKADIGIISAKPNLFDVAYPSKSTSYLLAGLPILVSAESDSQIAFWLKENRLGQVMSPENIQHAAQAIGEIVKQVRSNQYDKNDLAQRSAKLLSLDTYLASYRDAYLNSPNVKDSLAMNYSNDRLNFDINRHCFDELVLKAINDHLIDNGHPKIAALSMIHKIEGIEENVEKYRQILFSLFRTEAFQQAFKAFGKELIDQHFTPEALIQKTPTVRIHLPGGKSVSFHSDAWYGHGQKVCSFWLPLTPVTSTNSLHMARSIEESRDFLSRIESDHYDLDQINEQAEELCDPVEAAPGDLIVFNGDMVHGTVDNSTPKSRVSFDFRIAESISEIGTKPATNFHTRSELDTSQQQEEIAATTTCRHALMYSGTCRQISAKSQLIFLNEYAKLNRINIVGSESEIVTFNYGPVLNKYVKKPSIGMDSVLLFSVELLPEDPAVRNQIYGNAIENRIQMIFGAEGVSLSEQKDIAMIEQVLSDSLSSRERKVQLAA